MGVCMVCGLKDINEDDTPTFCSYECANVYDPLLLNNGKETQWKEKS